MPVPTAWPSGAGAAVAACAATLPRRSTVAAWALAAAATLWARRNLALRQRPDAAGAYGVAGIAVLTNGLRDVVDARCGASCCSILLKWLQNLLHACMYVCMYVCVCVCVCACVRAGFVVNMTRALCAWDTAL